MIVDALCSSFRREVLSGVHALGPGGDTFKLALFTSSANLSEATTAYSTANEASGSGYTAGGIALTSLAVFLDGDVAIADFADAVISGATVTAAGALIYNSSKGNKAVTTHSFGGDKRSIAGDFAIAFPAADAEHAVIRI